MQSPLQFWAIAALSAKTKKAVGVARQNVDPSCYCLITGSTLTLVQSSIRFRRWLRTLSLCIAAKALVFELPTQPQQHLLSFVSR